MGVPTLTLPGETFASRHSASHMSNAGLNDGSCLLCMIHRNSESRKARIRGSLADLRAGLRVTGEGGARTVICFGSAAISERSCGPPGASGANERSSHAGRT